MNIAVVTGMLRVNKPPDDSMTDGEVVAESPLPVWVLPPGENIYWWVPGEGVYCSKCGKQVDVLPHYLPDQKQFWEEQPTISARWGEWDHECT